MLNFWLRNVKIAKEVLHIYKKCRILYNGKVKEEDKIMIKRRLMTFCIMIFAMIAVVGAGFSSWYFSNQRRADVVSNVIVTHANTFGKFSGVSSGSYYLMLDQPVKNSSSAITNHNISLRDGTSETNSQAVDKLVATWTVSMSSFKDTLKDGTTVSIENSLIEYSVIIYIKASTLGQYIEIGGSTGFSNSGLRDVAGEHNHTKDGEYVAYKLAFTDLTNHGSDLVFENVSENTNSTKTGAYVTIPADGTSNVTVQFELDLASVPFEWKDGKAPDSFQKYQDMIQTLACTGVTSASDVKGGQIYQTTGNDIIFEFCAYNTSSKAPVIDVTTD